MKNFMRETSLTNQFKTKIHSKLSLSEVSQLIQTCQIPSEAGPSTKIQVVPTPLQGL
ncbi:hypothetical protein LXEBMM8_EKPBGFGD_02273 [Lactiplantibacillus xiangfangensis]